MRKARAHTPEGSPLLWVDAVKGLAIILVVFGHTWRGSWTAGVFADSPQALFGAIDARIYAFHMPLFFMVSGFFLISSLHRYDVAAFFKSRLMRLVWPMLLWSYIFTASKIIAGPLANHPLDLSWEVLQPIPGKWQFWFLWALFVLHMSVALLRPMLLNDRICRAALWGLMGLALVLVWVRLPLVVQYWTNHAANFLPYLVVGMLISAYGLLYQRTGPAGLAGLAIALCLIALVPALPKGQFAGMLVSLSICLGLVAGLSWISTLLPRLTAFLAYFGQASMVIFLSHTLFSAPVRIVLMKAGVTDPSTHILMGTLVGLLAPLILKYLIERTGKQALFGV